MMELPSHPLVQTSWKDPWVLNPMVVDGEMLGLLGLVETCLHCSFSCSPYSSITRWTKLGPRDVVVTRLFSTKDFTLPSFTPFLGVKSSAGEGVAVMVSILCMYHLFTLFLKL